MIELQEVSKTYGDVVALRGISLDIPAGVCFGLVGPNGAGKTSLLNILAGVLDANGGRVVTSSPGGAEGAGYQGAMLETQALFELLTGREYLEWICDVVGVRPASTSDRIRELSAALGLEPWLDQYILGYSRGTRKKVAFSAAVVTDPRLLILDEPFEGVDVPGVRTMKTILTQFQSAGATVVVSSHVLPVLEDLCSEFALIVRGEILARGTVEELAERCRALPGSDLESVYMDLVEPEHRTEPLTTLARPPRSAR